MNKPAVGGARTCGNGAVCAQGILLSKYVSIKSKTQKVYCLRAFSPSFASVPVSKSTKFNELRLSRFERQTEFLQASAQNVLESNSILSILETHHKVIDVAHQIRLSPQSGFDGVLEPKVKRVVQIQVAQQNADRAALWRSLLVRMKLILFQYSRFEPSSYQADHSRIPDSMFHKAQ